MNKARVSGELVQNWYYSFKAPNGEDFFENEIMVERNTGKIDKIQLVCSNVLIDTELDYSGQLVEIVGDIRLYRDSKDCPEKYAKLFVKEIRLVSVVVPENYFELEGNLGGVSPMREDEFGSTVYFRVKIQKSATAYDMLNCAAYNRNALRISRMQYGVPIKITGRLGHFWAKGSNGERKASFRCNASAIIENSKEEGGEMNAKSED